MNENNYIVIELQTTNGTTAIVPPAIYTNYETAMQKYYTILAAAVVSKVEVHTAVIMTETGRVVRAEHFKHETEVSE